MLPEDAVAETSGAALVNGGLTELKKLLEDLKEGGVLFIDEAYQLKPKMNPQGAQVSVDIVFPPFCYISPGTYVSVCGNFNVNFCSIPMHAMRCPFSTLPTVAIVRLHVHVQHEGIAREELRCPWQA